MRSIKVAAIEVEQIEKKFGDFTAVDHISFSVAPGEIFGLLGPNGAGKSTLIRMLTTLIEPTSGTARVNGFDIRQHPNDVRKSIGVIPQATTSDLDLSLNENLMIFAKLYGVPREHRKRDVKELLDAVDLGEWADKLADRVAIVDHGKLVALDTPFRLKASIPGENMLEVSFSGAPPDWTATLERLPGVASVKLYDHVYRIASRNGPGTTVELVEAARRAGVTVTALSVQSATLDDVFMHFTGRQLRDELQAPSAAESPFIMRR